MRGNVNGFVCSYHGWTYALDGKLINLRDKRDFVGLDMSCRSLIQVRCERFYNWVFVNEDPQAAAAASSTSRRSSSISSSSSPRPSASSSTKRSTCKCNVKVLLDAFLEVYHLKSIHQNTVDRFLDHRGTTIALYRNGHSIMVTPNRRPDWMDPGHPGMRRIETATRGRGAEQCLVQLLPQSRRAGGSQRACLS